MLTAPPATLLADDCPLLKDRSPPLPVFPLPTAIERAPPLPPCAVPEFIVTAPVVPELEVPEPNTIFPLTPEFPASPVVTVISPLDVCVLCPEYKDSSPPYWDAVVLPPPIETEPPVEPDDAPGLISILPAEPDVDDPVVSLTSPPVPEVVDPVDNKIAPLTPEEALTAVLILIKPLVVEEDPPDTNTMEPPVAPAAVPPSK